MRAFMRIYAFMQMKNPDDPGNFRLEQVAGIEPV